MKREEAVLRELNLHPLWIKRDGGEANTPEQGAPEHAAEPAAEETRELSRAATETTAVEAAAPEPVIVEDVSASAPVDVPEDAPALADAPVPADARAPADSPTPSDSRSEHIASLAWPELKTAVRDCTACKLRAGCTQTVFGVGDEKADWLFVGEGPGADEDAQGEPFVGQAGKLLDNMLLAIRLKRGDDVYIANIVKCRPPNNRAPEADEIATCMPYLARQVALIKPKVIVALGKTAANALLGHMPSERDATLGSLRGKVHEYHGTPLVITYHPAYLLRTPQDKAKAWEDLKLAMATAASR